MKNEGVFGLQRTGKTFANPFDFNGLVLRFWVKLDHCKFGIAVVKVNVFSSSGTFSKFAT